MAAKRQAALRKPLSWEQIGSDVGKKTKSSLMRCRPWLRAWNACFEPHVEFDMS